MVKVDIDTTVDPIMDLNSNKQLKPVGKRAKDATLEDIERMVSHIVKKDLEPGYPCQHRKVPINVVGDNQGSTWKDLHAEYEIKCKPCYIPEVQDQILEEAIELKKHAKHPLFDNEDDKEVSVSQILLASVWDHQSAEEDGMRNGACSNEASSPHPTPSGPAPSLITQKAKDALIENLAGRSCVK